MRGIWRAVVYPLERAGALLGGAALLGELTSRGRIGSSAASALEAWFWILGLHLVARALRSRSMLGVAASQS